MEHLCITISGKVQGVWYRASAQDRAIELGLKGYVCNLPDGRVYAEAEGGPAALKAFVDWCRQGPLMAIVTEVSATPGDWQGFNDFKIRK